MKTLLIYLAGFATPFVLWMAFEAMTTFQDWRSARRYQRAWNKFSAEFDALNADQLAYCRDEWDAAPYRYKRFCDDRSRYFDMRWQHGNAKDV